MADTDVFGILSLFLAAAGAAYLLWARLLRSGQGEGASSPSGGDRAADTVPPVLRPQSELSPAMRAKQEAKAGQASSRPPPPSAESEASNGAVASLKSEAPTVKVGRHESEPPKAEVASAKSDPPRLSAGAEALARSEGLSPAPVASNAESSTNGAKAESSTNGAKAEPSTNGAKAAPKKKSVFDELPRLDVEEDEELEPTKVGSLGKGGAIQPIVEKIVFDEGADAAPPQEAAPPLVLSALAQTDPGKRRKQNEDSFLVLEKESVFIVADGMGGHRGGQVASRLAVKTIGDAFEQGRFDAAPHEHIPLAASELARSMQMANTAIFDEAKMRPDLEGMGTTLCVARFTDDGRRMYLGHVGDSRCYRLRDGVMKQMTSDHTMADYGVAGPEGAHLSRAVGVWPTVPIDVIMASPKIGDVYLLCSDGLTKMIPDGTIATQLLHEEDPKAAVERLVFFANAHGGKDNITVILVRVVEQGWTPPSRLT
jgi:PPM family protein phosphatase